MGSKGSKTQTVQQKSDPWRYAQPYMRSAMSEAQLALAKTRNAPAPQASWNANLRAAENAAAGFYGQGFRNFSRANMNQAQNLLNPYANPAVKQGQRATANLPDFIQGIQNEASPTFKSADVWRQTVNANPFLYAQGSNPMDVAGASNVFNFAPNQTLGQMASATPNMDVYGPLMQQIADQGAQSFREQITPTIRTDALGAGAYGGGKHNLALAQAAERMGGQVADAQSRLAAQAASEALGQRSLAAQLGTGLAQHQSGLLGQLGSQQAAQQAAMAQQMAGMQGQFGQQQADIIMQRQGMQEQARQAQQGAGLDAARLGADFYGTSLGQALDASGRSMALAPGLASMGQLPVSLQMELGNIKNQINMGNTEARRNAVWQPVQNFADIAGGMGGMGGVSTTPYTTSPLMSGLGGAAMGSAFGPWGAIAGGALGLFGA